MDEINGTALLDEQQPSPPPSPRPSRNPFGNLFIQSAAEEDLSSPPAEETTPSAGAGSSSEWPSDELSDPDDSDRTSSPASSDSGPNPIKGLGKATLKVTTRKGILIASTMANRFATRTELEQLNGLYVADDEDQKNIGDPLASLIERHGGMAGGKISPDTADAISALMGLAGYAGKQMALGMQIRAFEANQKAGVATEQAQ